MEMSVFSNSGEDLPLAIAWFSMALPPSVPSLRFPDCMKRKQRNNN